MPIMQETRKTQNDKKALMICYYFPPCRYVGTLRSEKYVKYLGQFGWQSEVLTAYKPNKNVFIDAENVKIHTIRNIDLYEVAGAMITVRYFCINFLKRLYGIFNRKEKGGRQKNFVDANTGGVFRVAGKIRRLMLLPDSQCLWILPALPAALLTARQCDVIYSSGGPFSAHVLALIVHKITKKPWVADYRDEWTLNSVWFPPTRFHRWLGEKLDATCVKNARFVVNTTEIRTQNFINKFGGNADKYATIHNGYDEQDVAPYRKLKPPADMLIITSIGSLYGGRDARLLLSVLAEIIQDGYISKNQILLKLIGGQNAVLEQYIRQLEIGSCVEIIPRIPQPQAFEHLAKSHIALLVGSEMERYAMPTKVYEYAGMGKKILAIVPEGPVWDFVMDCSGFCAMYNDPAQIKQALRRIIDDFRAGLLNDQTEVNQNYERRNLAGQQAELFNLCISQDVGK